jgi:CubicO group peptidase (beta-lactamase class C family)
MHGRSSLNRLFRDVLAVAVFGVVLAPAAHGQERATAAGQPSTARPPSVSWDSLETRMKWEADLGFSGIVLVARDGKVVFHKAYGMANRAKRIAMRPDTILAIGSTPIDFTKAGILVLAGRGKLSLKDPITKYLDGVPEDKKAITIEHLLTGRSGLQDFHDLPRDPNPVHSWIDRGEAVRRILDQKLLFEPGKGRKASHSASGLLAVLIEIVSGQSYQDFTREHLFKPAGMKDTGFFGEKYAEERMAVGYGRRKDGEINAPPYWGKTSWLVMGSGGQVSTAEDMWRWIQAIKGGKILSRDLLKIYAGQGEGMLVGGDMYGFEIMYAGNPRSFMVVMSNAGTSKQMPRLRRLGEELTALVLDRKLARFTLGVQLEAPEGARLKVAGVLPGGPADRAGLRAGDVLVKAAGMPLDDKPVATLSKLLQSGDPIEFEIERGGKLQTVKVKPVPR